MNLLLLLYAGFDALISTSDTSYQFLLQGFEPNNLKGNGRHTYGNFWTAPDLDQKSGSGPDLNR